MEWVGKRDMDEDKKGRGGWRNKMGKGEGRKEGRKDVLDDLTRFYDPLQLLHYQLTYPH